VQDVCAEALLAVLANNVTRTLSSCLMQSAPGEEGRFELALSTSLLNELKYGSQLGKLAEALLLSAFSDNSIKPSLQQEIAAILPSVRYIR